MKRICPHCKIEKEYKTAQIFGAHITHCEKIQN